jgi:hypothetical protein
MNTKRLMGVCALALATLTAQAETVIPMQGQTPEQIQSDAAACQAQAKTAYDQSVATANQSAAASTDTTQPTGGRLRGAAVGAAAGAASAEVQGNRYENYDKLDSDVQQEYRQNQAKDAAVAGAVVGGAKQRQSRRQQKQTQEQQAQQQSAAAAQSADSASKQTYSACMTAKGYSISP